LAFFAQRIWAFCDGSEVNTGCIPDCVARGNCAEESFIESIKALLSTVFSSGFVLLILVGVIGSIIAYRKFGGDKNKEWVIWLAYFPLMATIAIILGLIVKSLVP